MDIKKVFAASAIAGFAGGFTFWFFIILTDILFSFDAQLVLFTSIGFQLACVALGLLCGIFYMILQNKKLYENQEINIIIKKNVEEEINNIIRGAITGLLFMFGVIMISTQFNYSAFDYDTIIFAFFSAASYYYVLEVLLGKLKWNFWDLI